MEVENAVCGLKVPMGERGLDGDLRLRVSKRGCNVETKTASGTIETVGFSGM